MLDLNKGRYIARPAVGGDDMTAVMALRGAVFRGDANRNDRDPIDSIATHMIVEDGISGEVACCFRFQQFPMGDDLSRSYAALTYDLTALAGQVGPLLEIGRFCIAPNADGPDVLRMAWAALTHIVDTQGVKVMFGCSSFAGTDISHHADSLALLKTRYVGPDNLRPKIGSDHIVRFDTDVPDQFDQKKALHNMPSLLRTYLTMGGWVSDHAVIDHDLDTVHVFTAVEIAKIPAARARALRALVDPGQSTA